MPQHELIRRFGDKDGCDNRSDAAKECADFGGTPANLEEVIRIGDVSPDTNRGCQSRYE